MHSTLSIRAICASALLFTNVSHAKTVPDPNPETEVVVCCAEPEQTKESFASFPIDGRERTYIVTLRGHYLTNSGPVPELNHITVVVPAALPNIGPIDAHINLLQLADELILSTTGPTDDACFHIHMDATSNIEREDSEGRHLLTKVNVVFDPIADKDGMCPQPSSKDQSGVRLQDVATR